jgi:hypothetical protein
MRLATSALPVSSHHKSDKVFLSESFGSFQLLAENKIPGQKRVMIHMLKTAMVFAFIGGMKLKIT